MFTFLISVILLHPVHETVAEIEWNAKTKRLEVALRLDMLDEQWLGKRSGRPKGLSRWAIGYLRQKFRVADLPEQDQRDPTSYHWIGRDEEGSHVWWYFEIEPADEKRPRWIDQRVLLEREEGYTNTILILDQVPPRSLTLTIKRPRANLDEAANESNAVDANSIPQPDRRSRFDRR